MTIKLTMAILAASALIVGCASKQAANQSNAPAPAATKTQPSTPGGRIVKSRNGTFEGEIVGTPAPKSRFAKLQIGMTMSEVSKLIGAPDDMTRHETGKRWIPFYFGNDAQRLQVFYKGEGCLTYTGGNAFGGGENELIRIMVASKATCMDS
jgi:hypothetical protein